MADGQLRAALREGFQASGVDLYEDPKPPFSTDYQSQSEEFPVFRPGWAPKQIATLLRANSVSLACDTINEISPSANGPVMGSIDFGCFWRLQTNFVREHWTSGIFKDLAPWRAWRLRHLHGDAWRRLELAESAGFNSHQRAKRLGLALPYRGAGTQPQPRITRPAQVDGRCTALMQAIKKRMQAPGTEHNTAGQPHRSS